MAEKITPRSKDFSQWYIDLVLNAKLADYSPVKGCMVIRPNGYTIWERIRDELDLRIKQTGHENAYFPLLIPESFMTKEAEHVEGFAPECAVVTHGGGKKLEEPLYIRPTSETIINSMFAKWIQSYRDLPMLINQWANIVRWEMRTRLFLRTTEFLWQEGHTCHATEKEAEEETIKMLHVYKQFSEDILAMPVITGVKTNLEKFAGAVKTYCVEAMMQDNKALQAGTSHNLGQNFAKAFNTQFQDETGKLRHVFQTSWGVSTRLIGALIMTHSDDKGLVLPPSVAPTTCITIPIIKANNDNSHLLTVVENINQELKKFTRAKIDARENYTPGWKFHEYELLGVPVRIEIGPKDLEKGHAVVVRRDTGEKSSVALENVVEYVKVTEDSIQKNLFGVAKKRLEERVFEAETFEKFREILEEPKGFVKAPFCEEDSCELKIKESTKATVRCIPLNPPKEEGRCVHCNKPSNKRVIFAKNY